MMIALKVCDCRVVGQRVWTTTEFLSWSKWWCMVTRVRSVANESMLSMRELNESSIPVRSWGSFNTHCASRKLEIIHQAFSFLFHGQRVRPLIGWINGTWYSLIESTHTWIQSDRLVAGWTYICNHWIIPTWCIEQRAEYIWHNWNWILHIPKQ